MTQPAADDSDALARALDVSFAAWAAGLSAEERVSVQRWQSTARFYEGVQRAHRVAEAKAHDDVVAIIENLDRVIERGHLDREVVAYRGIRSLGGVFGINDPQDASQLIGEEVAQYGYLGTTVFRPIAAEEFTRPHGPGGAVLLRLAVPLGTDAAWLPLVGSSALGYQGELLLGAGRSIVIRSVDLEDHLLVISSQVLP